MRILCLHGVGSSGAILESQLRPFMRAVDPSYEFVFVDGPVQSPRGPGMGAFHDGLFFSHTSSYSPTGMSDALSHLSDVISDLGPFDGVLGFSQGAALALSYLHQQQSRREPAPFRFALCFSSVIPCSAESEHCHGIVQRLCALPEGSRITSAYPDAAAEGLDADEALFVELLRRTILPAKKHNAMLPDYDIGVYTDGDGFDAPRLMAGGLLAEKVAIPTVHVTGKRDHDFMRNMAEVAYGICDARLSRRLEHAGGHQPPQKDSEVKAAVRAMDWAIRLSERTANLRL
ncbi:uncharacterized protein BKCO1_4100019 [Diplodia corticola]|uniref:Serine hydrolase domain-containing protein n=1 Tax=Diplodia corticola TaxID=236234 RepID=A0A1J9QVR2_9PEZI|nr:uncharacterized protein BKCO1_4100019 [Diplodia corticola]OJD32082.1 hypothetical protein BKCO1_4100019 [Diplodia corticola]